MLSHLTESCCCLQVPAQLQRKPAKRNGNRNPDSSMKRPNSPLDSKPDPAPAPTQPQNPHQRVTLNLSTALGLYKLTDSELFWETKLDTQCLLGWNDHTIVVAFRGTASMKNALSDVQVSQSLLSCCSSSSSHRIPPRQARWHALISSSSNSSAAAHFHRYCTLDSCKFVESGRILGTLPTRSQPSWLSKACNSSSSVLL